MNTLTRLLLLFLLPLTLLCPASLHAQDAQLRQRIAERLPAVDALKKAGLAGENNQALLEARGTLDKDQQALIKAENDDRLAAYALIAKNTNAPLATVQTQRAKQIAERSAPGIWLQTEKGEWYRK